MSGPFAFAREAVPLDAYMAQIDARLGGSGWDPLKGEFHPAPVHDRFDPGDDMKMVLAAFHGTADGRKVLEWIFDLTVRAPYPSTSGTGFEMAALAAAKHEARVAVGRVICQAIADGRELFDKKRSHSNAKPD